MAKKQRDAEREERRLSRKEVLLARRQRERDRQVRIAVALVAGLLLLVVLVAVVIEGFVRPANPVAVVNGTEISLREWQERVRFQRAQFIIALEDQLEAFGGDVGLVQQFNQQQMSLLLQPELLGELVLEQMVNEEIVREQAAVRGLEVSDGELQARIEEGFNYFGGESPTPFPTPTQTVEPTPSLTPVPTSVITEVVTAPTPLPTQPPGPTSTPLPTATPVSEDAFEQEYSTVIERFRDMGAKEETYRSVLRAQILREKLAETLAEETQMSPEGEHASVYVLTFESADEAEAAAAAVEETNFLDVWNRIRSLPADDEAGLPGSANELLWQTQPAIEQRFGPEVAEAAFSLPLNEPSDIMEVEPGIDQLTGLEQEPVFYLLMVSGREIRELPEATLETQRQQLVSELIEARREAGTVEILTTWQGHAPTQPVLDPIFRQQPTPVPGLPTPTPGA
ncbi:MAG: SurA N-terminal domain-containing protein [Anaerolineae bacterium]|nr:SurA N-terminal domain-containing protein [Anaerolineae bacterium]